MLICSAVKSLQAKNVEHLKLALLFRGFRASSHFSGSAVRSRFSELNSRRRPMSVLNYKGIAPLGVMYSFHRGSIPLDYPFWQLTLKLIGKSPSEISWRGRSFTAQQTIQHKHNTCQYSGTPFRKKREFGVHKLKTLRIIFQAHSIKQDGYYSSKSYKI